MQKGQKGLCGNEIKAVILQPKRLLQNGECLLPNIKMEAKTIIYY
jgi:hypothetical protein